MIVGGVVALVVGLLGLSALRPVVAQQQDQGACLHGPGETDVQKDRRVAAVAHMRTITRAEFKGTGQGPFVPLDQIAGLSTPPSGFTVQLVASPSEFLLSVKDTRDPCHFSLFTDQAGLIYIGQPLQ